MIDYHEKEWVKALINGDLDAFEHLFNKYYKKIYHFAKGYLKNEEDAEDLLQEVFAKVWESRKDIKEHLSFNSFIYTITYHAILKFFRSKGREKKYLDQYSNKIEKFVDDTDHKIDYQLVLDQIMHYLEEVPERRRRIFIMSRFEGITNDKIAEELNISRKTVENHIHKVLKFLRKQNEQLFLLLFICLFLG